MNKRLLNPAFLTLVYSGPVLFAATIVIVALSLVLASAKYDLLFLAGMSFILYLVMLFAPIVAFFLDRSFLKKQGVFCPHWGWFFLTIVYVYKRQKHNQQSMLHFWFYLVFTLGTLFLWMVLP